MQIQHLIKAKQPEVYEALQKMRGNLKNMELLETAALTEKEKGIARVMGEKRAVEVTLERGDS